jgi:hypothetical protein
MRKIVLPICATAQWRRHAADWHDEAGQEHG